MENSTLSVGVGTYLASGYLHVAIADLEVFERAVTQHDPRGELCPQGRWADTKLQLTAVQRASLRSGFGITSIQMSNVRNNVKPRPGSHAFSGTG